MTTFTPSNAKARAQPQPNPLLAPPTNAHLPLIPKSMMTPSKNIQQTTTIIQPLWDFE
jgi:hypothetical protein